MIYRMIIDIYYIFIVEGGLFPSFRSNMDQLQIDSTVKHSKGDFSLLILFFIHNFHLKQKQLDPMRSIMWTLKALTIQISSLTDYYITLFYIISYQIIWSYLILFHIKDIIWYCIISYDIIQYHIISYYIILYYTILYYNIL